MANSMVHAQTEQVAMTLKESSSRLENFLNETTLLTILENGEFDSEYTKQLLHSIRRLNVFCMDGFESCSVILNNDPFIKGAAEKALYRIYHQCVEEFFSPKNDVWFEDSRSAYTGKNSIKFYKNTHESIQSLISSLEAGMQSLREELEFYETDFRTKMVQSD